MSTTKQVFISYAAEDELLCASLEKHLSPLERSGQALIWHEGKLLPGDVGHRVLEDRLGAADVILFIVTPDLLASDTLHNEQLRPALERARTGATRVVPILAKPCAWRGTPLAQFEPLPRNRTPVALWIHADEGWAEIVDSLSEVLSQELRPLKVAFPEATEPRRFYEVGSGLATYYRLRVLNQSQGRAEGCVGELLSVATLGSPDIDLLGKPMTLKWAHEVDFSPISISPDESRLLDLFCILDGSTHLEFCINAPILPVGVRDKFPIGSYLARVRVAPRDAPPSIEFFCIEPIEEHSNMRVRTWHPLHG